jgi:hypothetical protein
MNFELSTVDDGTYVTRTVAHWGFAGIVFQALLMLETRFENPSPVTLGGAQERTHATEARHEGLPARDVPGSAVELVRVVLADLPYTAR